MNQVASSSQLDDLCAILRFPSISTDSRHNADTLACGQWLVNKFNAMGLQAELRPTDGHPVVIAKNNYQTGRTTVLIYGHYDVQPADPLELWHSQPFEPRIEGDKLYARGATDNKGQLMCHVLAAEQLLAGGADLGINLCFLIEGEEEIGSPNLGAFIDRYRDELSCDVILVSDTGMVAAGQPTLSYGLRGIACGELLVKGPASDLHSGVYGGIVMNPARALSQLLAGMHDAGNHIRIDGFYEHVRPLENWERESWAKIACCDNAELQQQVGCSELVCEQDYSAAECLWARPTAEINGIGGGYQGEGSKTVIASQAMAKLSFRLVPDQQPADILDKVEKHFKKYAPQGVSIEFVRGHDGQPYLADINSKYAQEVKQALQEEFGREAVLIREGGSIPIITTFQQKLGVDSLLIGLALPDCRIHAPNENFSLTNFYKGIALSANILTKFAKLH